jgi:hypothetical protein
MILENRETVLLYLEAEVEAGRRFTYLPFHDEEIFFVRFR